MPVYCEDLYFTYYKHRGSSTRVGCGPLSRAYTHAGSSASIAALAKAGADQGKSSVHPAPDLIIPFAGLHISTRPYPTPSGALSMLVRTDGPYACAKPDRP